MKSVGFLRSQRGLSLIEVIIAMMIMAGTLVLISNSWSGNLVRVRKTNIYNTVGMLLQKQLTEVEIKYRETPLDEIPEEGEGGDFGEQYKNYRWTMTSKKFKMPDLSQILISQEGGADEMLLMLVRQVTENINESVKEVTVSVFVKVGKNETEYSATTYFVDYNRGLKVEGGL